MPRWWRNCGCSLVQSISKCIHCQVHFQCNKSNKSTNRKHINEVHAALCKRPKKASSKCSSEIFPDLDTKNFVDIVHVGQATYYFTDHCVKPRAKTSACYNACIHVIWFKVHLNKYKVTCQLKSVQTNLWSIHSGVQPIQYTLWRGPARLKWIPLGLSFWTTTYRPHKPNFSH